MPVADGKILIADDEEPVASALEELMRKQALTPFLAYDGPSAVRMVRSVQPDVLLVDYRMPGMHGIDVMRAAKAVDEDLPVILITGYADVHGAVEAMREGAHDYLAKPFENGEVMRVTLRALSERNLKRKLRTLSSHLRQSGSLRETMGPSEAVARLAGEVQQVARSDFGVLISGETGSGKEVVARAIHQHSARARNPFIPLDCGAIPEALLESELFGHEKGSFTGALAQKPGLFEVASGGTLFLDEVSNLALSSQAKMLRVLQEKTLMRVGGSKPIPVDARVIAATNHDLRTMVQAGAFRHDLYFRLNEYSLRVMPLRERKSDIPYLTKRFLDITNVELGKDVEGLSPEAAERLLAYDWPGNVRELRSVIRRAVLRAARCITEDLLEVGAASTRDGPPASGKAPDMEFAGLPLREMVRRNTAQLEREVLRKALQQTNGNKAKAARLLQIDYKTIHSKVKEYGLNGGGAHDQTTPLEEGDE